MAPFCVQPDAPEHALFGHERIQPLLSCRCRGSPLSVVTGAEQDLHDETGSWASGCRAACLGPEGLFAPAKLPWVSSPRSSREFILRLSWAWVRGIQLLARRERLAAVSSRLTDRRLLGRVRMAGFGWFSKILGDCGLTVPESVNGARGAKLGVSELPAKPAALALAHSPAKTDATLLLPNRDSRAWDHGQTGRVDLTPAPRQQVDNE